MDSVHRRGAIRQLRLIDSSETNGPTRPRGEWGRSRWVNTTQLMDRDGMIRLLAVVQQWARGELPGCGHHHRDTNIELAACPG